MAKLINPLLHLMPKTLPIPPVKTEVVTPAKVEILPPVAPTAISTAKNPFASLMAAPTAESIAADKALTQPRNQLNQLSELAAMNTESLEPNTGKPETNINVKAAVRSASLMLESPEEVRQLCDRVDQMIESNEALSGPPLIELRGYVQRLMITLKERPEFDSIVIDKDIRNVMRFIRATREETLALREVKTERKAKREANKAVKVIKDSPMKDAFNAIMLGGKLKL